MFLAIILLFAGVVQGDAQQAKSKTTSTPVPIQKPASPTPPTPNQSQKVQSKQVKTAAPGAKTSQKARTWQVSVKDSFGVPFITIHAKKAPRSEISAEIARLLKIPVTLGASIRPQQITGDFEDYPLEAVVKLLAPRPFIDYVISGGGDTTRPARKTPIAHTDTEHHSIQRFVLLGRRGRRLQDDNCGAHGRQLAGGDGGLLEQ